MFLQRPVYLLIIVVFVVILSAYVFYIPKENMETELNQNGPFEIVLKEMGDSELQATLINRSVSNQLFLVHSWREPLNIVVHDQSGKEIKPFDELTIKIPQASAWVISKDQYENVPPGQEIILGTGSLVKQGESYTLRWGHLIFGSLKPGSYKIQAVAQRKITFWEKDEQGKSGDFGTSTWVGDVPSNVIEVQLK